MKLLDFVNIIGFLTVLTGVIALTDMVLRRFTVHADHQKINVILDYSRSFFPVLLIVLLLRCFVFQPYRVPSESLEPTVMPGDFLFVTQYNYGLKLPFWDKTFIKVGHPQRGQIAVFRSTVYPTGLTLVKRVIGLPGDRISYVNKVLTINGHEMKQSLIKTTDEVFADGRRRRVKEYQEDLAGIKHFLLRNPLVPAKDFKNLVVPKGEYFMMGDNRDDSDDSRGWGFAPEQNFIGQAKFIFLNIEHSPFHLDWHRIGTVL